MNEIKIEVPSMMACRIILKGVQEPDTTLLMEEGVFMKDADLYKLLIELEMAEQ